MGAKKLNLLFIVIASMIFMGCSKSSSKNKRLNRNGRTAGQVIGQDGRPVGGNFQGFANSCSGYSGQLSGAVFSNQGFGNQFQYTVESFLSALADPYTLQLGFVDSNCGSQTGIRFDGQVDLDQGFSLSGQNFGYVRSGGNVIFSVIDSTALETGQGAITINGYDTNGYVEGNYAAVEVYWDGGLIYLEGQIDYQSGLFMGQISYQNYVHYAGQGGDSGYLGSFDVPLCDFFRCMN